MISQTAFVTLSVSGTVMIVALGTLFTTLLSGRIGDVVERLARLETKIDTVQGAVTDVGARLTRLETNLGSH